MTTAIVAKNKARPLTPPLTKGVDNQARREPFRARCRPAGDASASRRLSVTVVTAVRYATFNRDGVWSDPSPNAIAYCNI